jgi:hypothetical protein
VKRVLMLGAGFSRAISGDVPLTDELGTLVMSKLGEPHYSFKGGYFEMWLSRLAEAQPDLREEQNYANYSQFLRIADAVYEVMVERQLEVMREAPPPWLMRLVGIAQARRIATITFNYDTLLEKAADARRLLDWQHGRVATTVDILGGLPPLAPGVTLDGDLADSFRLLKLHGSIDSFWVPGDSSGATISRWESLGYWGNPTEPDQQRRRRELPGRSAFIVPPAAGKSAFYSNPLTRELWRSAAEALDSADTVTLVGYSIPSTDLVASGMLAERVAGRETLLEVVNRSPTAIVERLKLLGVREDSISVVDGDSAVEHFVDMIEDETNQTMLPSLLARPGDPMLLVALDDVRMSPVTGIEFRNSTLRLMTLPLSTDLNSVTRPFPEGEHPRMGLDQLRTTVLGTSASTIVAVLDGELECPIIDHQWADALVPAANGRWLVLVPSAAPTGGVDTVPVGATR